MQRVQPLPDVQAGTIAELEATLLDLDREYTRAHQYAASKQRKRRKRDYVKAVRFSRAFSEFVAKGALYVFYKLSSTEFVAKAKSEYIALQDPGQGSGGL